MKLNLLLKYLQGLFTSPSKEWQEIEKEYMNSTFYLIKSFYLVFFLLIPTSFLLKHIIQFRSIKLMLTQGLIIPVIALITFIFVLYLTSIVIEEIALLLKARVPHLAGAKIAYFASLPLLSLMVLFPIPYAPYIILPTSFFYSLYLLKLGGSTILQIQGSKITIWMIGVFLTFILIFFLFALLTFLGGVFLSLF